MVLFTSSVLCGICAGTAILAVSIFTTGFFPDVGKSVVFSGVQSVIADRRCSARKTVLLLIDALRRDMIFADGEGTATQTMPFLSSARSQLGRRAASRNSFSAVVRVQAPTVTLPRIKCLTTGRVPGFLDVLWNFFASELTMDSIVVRWRAANRNVHFYGDDTWTKMFPQGFARFEGVSSFFASDFYEVDKNVTRNLRAALADLDTWEVLILHYLGLDHIGHIEGPNSRLIPAKLAEMDSVIESIVTALRTQSADWLLVLTSDHGMSDLGGHGGASPSETQTPLVLLTSVSLAEQHAGHQLPVLEQTDLVNLLSAWTGVQPPRGSLGLLHPSLSGVACGNSISSVSALLSNNWLDLLELEAETDSKPGGFNRSDWSKWCANAPGECYKAARRAQRGLVYASAEYSLSRMLLGLALGCISCCMRLPAFWHGLLPIQVRPDPSPALARISSLTAALLTFGTCLAPALIYASTSLIEEEHQLWYFACTSLCACLLLTACLAFYGCRLSRRLQLLGSALLPLVAFRIARCFNQTGDKWAHLPDLDDELRSWPITYASLLTVCVCLLCRFINTRLSCATGASLSNARRLALIGYSCCAVLLRCRQVLGNSTDPLLGFVGLLLAAVWTFSGCCGQGFAVSAAGGLLMCQLVLASRPSNCAVLCLHCLAVGPPLARQLISVDSGDCRERYLLALAFFWLGQALHFQLGQSNSLATVDVAASFAGLPFNSMLLSGFFLVLITWTGPLFYLLLLLLTLQSAGSRSSSSADFSRASNLIGLAHLLASYSWCSLALFCIVQRHHLFVWTVYAPKFCYSSAYLALLSVLYLFTAIFGAN